MSRHGLRTGDWLVPLGLFVYGVTEAALGLLGPARDTVITLGMIGVACAVLVDRRRHALLALLAIAAYLPLQLMLGLHAPAAAGTYVFTTAAFACGRYARRPLAYAAVPLGAATVTAALVLDPEDSVRKDWFWILFVVPVFVIGAWFRQQREQSEREATQRVRTAAAEERVQIARELHDVLAHSVTLMVIQAEAAEELLRRRPDTAQDSLHKIQHVGRQALQDTRRLLAVLRTPEETSPHAPLPGLAELPQLVAAMRASGLPVDYRATLDDVPVPEVAGRAVYRVLQEALTNTLRHAGAVPTTVRIGADRDRLFVDIQDRGTTRPSTHSEGHGLIGMRERVESCGGSLATAHTPAGFHVRAEIPLEGGAAT